MDQSHVFDLIDDLADNIDDLKSALSSLKKPGSTKKYAETLPILDRAKLYTTITYALQSLLFNHLQLAGRDAKNSPVMTELARVKQHFENISKAESPNESKAAPAHPAPVNKPAASRVIRHELAGNKRLGQAIAAGAKRKLDALPTFTGKKIKFDEDGQYAAGNETDSAGHDSGVKKVFTPQNDSKPATENDSPYNQETSGQKANRPGKKARRRARKAELKRQSLLE